MNITTKKQYKRAKKLLFCIIELQYHKALSMYGQQSIDNIKYSLQVSISNYLANKKRDIHIINYTKNQIINN